MSDVASDHLQHDRAARAVRAVVEDVALVSEIVRHRSVEH